VEETGDAAVGCATEHEQRVLVVEPEERVERHHEAPLGLRPAPRARELLELLALHACERARRNGLGRVARTLQAVHGLADLADRPALEREPSRLDDRLVTVVQRVQVVLAIEVQCVLRRAEDRDAPAARPGELEEGSDERGEAIRRADRIAGHDRDAAHDLVGHERRLVVVEEVRLVAAQHERGERVGAPGRDEIACEAAVVRLERVLVAPRCKPARQQQAGAAHAQEQDGEREPFAERPGEVARALGVHADRGERRIAQRERERERLIGHHAVEPERDEAVRADRAREQQRAQGKARLPLRISRRVEVASPGQQCDGDESRGDRAVAEAVLEVQRDEEEQDHDRELPGAPFPPRQSARGDEQREAERCD
jgi:hypothetical protein